MHKFIEILASSSKKDASEALGADILYAIEAVIWAVLSLVQDSLANDIAYMRLLSLVFSAFSRAFKLVVYLLFRREALKVSKFLYKLRDSGICLVYSLLGHIDVCSSLRADDTVIGNKCV